MKPTITLKPSKENEKLNVRCNFLHFTKDYIETKVMVSAIILNLFVTENYFQKLFASRKIIQIEIQKYRITSNKSMK